MASRGRGRGRDLGVSPVNVSEGRKPGGAGGGGGGGRAGQIKIPGSLQELKTYLCSLNESNFQSYGGTFADMVLGYANNERKMQETVGLIFDTTVRDRDNAEMGAKICEKIAMTHTSGSEPESKSLIRSEFRKVLLARFQKEYGQKEETRSRSVEAWLSVFAFLCEVYVRIKVGDKPIMVVGKAILSMMNFLLSLSDYYDDEIDCLCTCLKVCGKYLEEQSPKEVEKLVHQLRSRLITQKSSCRVRCLIMEVLELRLMGWSDPEKRLDEFYVDALPDAIAEDELGGDR